jgi:hypothetical protein
VTYNPGVPPRPIALVQLCWRAPAAEVAAGAPPHVVALLHVAHSGVTPALRALLESGRVRKAGVGVHLDALKIGRDFGIRFGGVLDLSDAANARLCGSEGGPPAPQRWSLAALCARLFAHGLPKAQGLRCSDWERWPLSAAQRAYAATDAWAGLLCHERLERMPPIWQPPAAAAAASAAAAAAGDGNGALVPATAAVAPVQPAKAAAAEAHLAGLSAAAIAEQRSIKEDTAEAYITEAITAGWAYAWDRLGVDGVLVAAVARGAAALLGRELAAELPAGAAAAPPVDLLAELLQHSGGTIRQLKEAHFEEVPYGKLRLALAHLSRCNPAPAPAEPPPP